MHRSPKKKKFEDMIDRKLKSKIFIKISIENCLTEREITEYIDCSIKREDKFFP